MNNTEKNTLKAAIIGGGLIGTAFIYKTFGFMDLLGENFGKTKTLEDIINGLQKEIKARSVFDDEQPSVIDEKTNSIELARLYYYGFPYDFPRKEEKALDTSPSTASGPLNPVVEALIEAAKNISNSQNGTSVNNGNSDTIISLLMKKIVDINASLSMMPPEVEMKEFMETEYYKYKEMIISSYNDGVKLRIPHQPLLSCLPLILDLLKKNGHAANETASLYRLIAYQKTLLNHPSVDARGNRIGDTIIDGYDIRTGKKVTEEAPPDNSVVIPTSGPMAGQPIPIGDTAVM